MQPASLALELLYRLLTNGESGVNAALGRLQRGGERELPLLNAEAISIDNAPLDLLEKSGTSRYPCLHLVCERMRNNLREKFRTFSGSVDLSVELRVSSDRLDEATRDIHSYVGAVIAVLDGARGHWAPSVYYPGLYEVAFAPMRAGGRRYVQTAKIALAVNIAA